MSSTNITPVHVRDSSGYKCCFCSERSQTLPDLKQHTISSHDQNKQFMKNSNMHKLIIKLDVTNLKCKICDQSFDNIKDITEHLTSKHDKKFYTGLKCPTVSFRSVDDLIQCGECSDTFRSFIILLKHMNSHFPNHVCEICGSGFLNKNILLAHSIRHVIGEFKCSHCGKIYDTYAKKRDHEYAIHVQNNLRNKCSYCGEKFRDYTKKHKHEVAVHGAEPVVLKCRACDRTFDNQRALTVHTKSQHR